MISSDALTSGNNYFDDFHTGQLIAHERGKTVTEFDTVFLTATAMNTAQAHFNEHHQQGSGFGQRVTFGGITAAIVLGLASEDTAEHAVAELGLTGLRLPKPVFHGDTLYAYSEVLETDGRPGADAGEVRFAHWGVNQDGDTVFEAERRVLLARAPSGHDRGKEGG